MITSINDAHSADQKLLLETPQFKILEERIQDWVLNSPLASAEFARFFRDGGKIIDTPEEPLASYQEENPKTNTPVIRINPTYFPLRDFEGKDTIVRERALFAMLAHEIGHHVINSRTLPFTGTTYQAAQLHRAEHEAMTVLNAFRIFEELQQRDPAYMPDFGSVGYGLGAHLGGIYNQWLEHRDDRPAIREISSIVLSTNDKRTELGLDNVPDYNGDGKHTHAERFRRDWEESEKRRQNPIRQEMQPNPADPERDHGPSIPPQPEKVRRPDPRDLGHPDHTFYQVLRQQLPPQTSDDMVAHVMLQAKIGGVLNVGELDKVIVRDDRVFVMGATPGFRTDVYLTETPPPIQETTRRSEDFDRQRAQDHAQWLAQEAQLSQSRGMRYSL